MEATQDQRFVALDMANTCRHRRSQIKHGLAHGTLTLEAVLTSPPAGIAARPAYEIASWVRGVGEAELQRLGEDALVAGVNLAAPVSRMSGYSRAWLASRVQARYLGRAA